MTKLTQKERESFESIMAQDMTAINRKMAQQIREFWSIARKYVENELGYDKLVEEKEKLYEEQKKIRDRIHMIETKLQSKPLKPEQIAELGGKENRYGRYGNATFHGIPVTSQFDYRIVEYIRENINLEVPAKFIHDLGRSCMRALAMAGTFEEAREAYEKFYSLDFRKYGVDIPPRLSEVKEQLTQLNITKQTLSLDTDSQKPMLENKEKEDDYIG